MTPEGRQQLEELIADMRWVLPPSVEGKLVQDGWIAWHYKIKKWSDRLLALLLVEGHPHDSDKEWHQLLFGQQTIPPHERALSFLRIWANSYLAHGQPWDVPQTMANALNQAIRLLEAPAPATPTRQEKDGEEHDDQARMDRQTS